MYVYILKVIFMMLLVFMYIVMIIRCDLVNIYLGFFVVCMVLIMLGVMDVCVIILVFF